MLLELSVKNFAIIEDLSLKFNNDMTVLTGETGAGKSLIIDTISLLLGARADSDMIRYGESFAKVLGVFTHNHRLDDLFNSNSIKILDNITILREVHSSGRNVIKINDTNVTLQILKNVSIFLADIHVQNDLFKLFNPDNYLSFLDPKSDSKFDKLIFNYSKALYNYLDKYKLYDRIVEGNKNLKDKLEFLEYEKKELEGLELYSGIDIELNDKVNKLSNFDKIKNNLIGAYNALSTDNGGIDLIYEASKELSNISSFDDKFSEYSEKLMDMYYISTDIKDDIAKELDSLDYDEDELNNSIDRLNRINKAKDKYKRNVDELIKYLDEINLELDMNNNYDELLANTKKELEELYNKLKDSSIKLTEYRKKLAIEIEKGIILEASELDLENTNFKVVFNDVKYDNYLDKSIFNDNGVDSVDFMISFNKGEPLKSLYKVASGGEMSRIMLAFKSYFSKNSVSDLIIFDEIDTGVSGVTAKKIAIKMKKIASSMQVLCITHLPQVAAMGKYHKHIYKISENDRTKTMIEDLSGNERIEEIAKMLSGDKISLYALEHAKELIEG